MEIIIPFASDINARVSEAGYGRAGQMLSCTAPLQNGEFVCRDGV